jgi:hypothetical protein
MSEVPDTRRRSRRNVLAVGGATALAAAAGAVVRPDQALAGTDGDVVLGASNTMADGQNTKILGNSGEAAFYVQNAGTGSNTGGIGVFASNGNGANGVYAESQNGIGVFGADIGAGIGVYGEVDVVGGTGVKGQAPTGVHGTGALGVLGESLIGGIGVKALVTGSATQGTAVVASTIGDPGSVGGHYGVFAYGGTAGVFGQSVDTTGAGVIGESDVGGVGVQAIAIRPGKALDVQGAASFSTSGLATVAGTVAVPLTSIVITGADVTQGSVVLATPQTHVGGVAVSAAVVNPTTKTITIFLTKAVTKTVKIAWFTLN